MNITAYATFSLQSAARHGFVVSKDINGNLIACSLIHIEPLEPSLVNWPDRVTFPVTRSLSLCSLTPAINWEFLSLKTSCSRQALILSMKGRYRYHQNSHIIIPHAPLWDDFVPDLKAA